MHRLSSPVLCLLLLLSVSCAGLGAGDGKQQAAPPRVDDKVLPKAPPADRECSYFHYLWGKSAELQGEERYEEALEAYQKALICDEHAYTIMLDLAMLHLRMGKRGEALEILERIIDEDPDNIQARLLLANLHISRGFPEEAEKVLLGVLARYPDNRQVMVVLGSLYARQRLYEKAQKMFESLVAADPEASVGHEYLARLYRELQLYGKATESFEKALSLTWSAVLAFELAELYEFQQREDEAIRVYQRLIDEEDGNERARARLAGIYLRQGRIDEALELLETIRQNSTDPFRVDLSIGKILLDNKRYDEAIRYFSRLAAEHPESPALSSLLALAHYQKGEKEQAKNVLRRVSPELRGHDEVLLMLVRFLHEDGENVEAERLLKSAIRRGGEKRVHFIGALASLYFKQNKLPEARRMFEEAMAATPADMKLLFEYGMFLERIGESEAAMAKIQEVLKKNPHDPYALNYVGYMWADAGMNLDKALEYLEEASALKPDDGFIRDSLGWVYFRLERYDEALVELERAAEIEPDDPAILEHLGEVYLKVGRIQEALEAFRDALELYEELDKKEAVEKRIKAIGEGR